MWVCVGGDEGRKPVRDTMYKTLTNEMLLFLLNSFRMAEVINPCVKCWLRLGLIRSQEVCFNLSLPLVYLLF